LFCAVFRTRHTCNVLIPYATFNIKICEFVKLAFHEECQAGGGDVIFLPSRLRTVFCDVTPRILVGKELALVDLQLDAQYSYLFTYNTFMKILYMFRALPCSSSGGVRHNCIYAASGIVTVCRRLSCAPGEKEFFLNRCTGQSPAELFLS